MAGLSQRDMDVLADYAKAGNRELYLIISHRRMAAMGTVCWL